MSKYDKEYYHNKGQEDASEGRYDAPHGLADQIFSWSSSEAERHKEENDSYDGGWHHTDSQTSENNGGCFLTTACVDHFGLQDNCHELETLRRFRDQYVKELEEGEEVLCTYYNSAPKILVNIDRSGNTNLEMPVIFKGIQEAVALIESGNNHEAFTLYSKMFSRLNRRYCKR